jgi:hypothetical protein
LVIAASSFFVHVENCVSEPMEVLIIGRSTVTSDQIVANSRPSVDFSTWLLHLLADISIEDTSPLLQDKILFQNLLGCLNILPTVDQKKVLHVMSRILQSMTIDINNDTIGIKVF